MSVDDEYARFVATVEWHRFTSLCERFDRRREAMAQLGYSDRPAVFTEVGVGVVPSATVSAVDATVTLCVALLGVDRPSVHWFRPESGAERGWRLERGPQDLDQFEQSDNVVGRAIRGERQQLWVRADLPLGQAMRVAAHECRHLDQTNPDDLTAYIDNEHDARTFEAEFARAYLNDN